MSSRACLSFLFLVVSVAASADWGDFARVSDAADDPLLLQVIEESDLGTALVICEGVGKRAEPFAGDLIEALAASRAGRGTVTSELLLRTLLAGLLDPGRVDPPLSARVQANAAALQMMLDSVATIADPQLVAALVRILPSAPGLPAVRPLMEAGGRIVRLLTQKAGMLDPGEAALAMDLLEALRGLGSADFLDLCASLVRLSRDPDIVSAARKTASILAPLPPHR